MPLRKYKITMSLQNYFIGYLKCIFRKNISKLALVDKYSKVDTSATIHKFTKLFQSSIGAYSYIATGTELTHAKIGNFCSIGRDCYVGLPLHSINNISTSPLFTEKTNATGHSWVKTSSVIPFKEVKVGNDVWIGNRVIIMGGITVGDGAVIGAGSIITKDVPPFAVYAGVPGKLIKYRFDVETIKVLLDLKWWDLPEMIIKNNIDFFKNPNITIEELKIMCKINEVK